MSNVSDILEPLRQHQGCDDSCAKRGFEEEAIAELKALMESCVPPEKDSTQHKITALENRGSNATREETLSNLDRIFK